MAKRNLSTLFQSLLWQFVGEADPLLSMLEWMTQQLMPGAFDRCSLYNRSAV